MKLKLFILSLLTIVTLNSFSQRFDGHTSKVKTPDGKEHFNVTPKYPGGRAAFFSELSEKINYRRNNKQVRTKVLISFVIDIYGKIGDIKIIESGGEKLDKKCIKALKKMKKFIPAKMDGKAVPTTIKLPLVFQ